MARTNYKLCVCLRGHKEPVKLRLVSNRESAVMEEASRSLPAIQLAHGELIRGIYLSHEELDGRVIHQWRRVQDQWVLHI